MTQQSAPNVTSTDVERVVCRDFSPGTVSKVHSLLEEYGNEAWEREAVRVRLAALKLAAGDIVRLRHEIENAKRDYRDVIAAAEYPAFMERNAAKLSPQARQQVVDADWRQYREWLEQG